MNGSAGCVRIEMQHMITIRKTFRPLTILSVLAGVILVCMIILASQDRQVDVRSEQHAAVVRLVLVDVIVTQDGKFVTDLAKDDFVLYEDGEEVAINSFDLVGLSDAGTADGRPPTKAVAPPPSPHRMVFLFDCINSWARDVDTLKTEAEDELLELVRLGNQVLVLQLTWDQGLEILQPFTTDENQIQAAVEKAMGTWWESGSQLAVIDGIDASLDDSEFGVELKKYINAQQLLDHRVLERNKLEKTIGGVLSACNMLREFKGRKSILLISSGIPDLTSPNPVAVIPTGTRAVSSSSRATLDAVHAVGYGKKKVRIFDPFHLLKEKEFENGAQAIEELSRFANSFNISIHSLVPVLMARTIFTGTTAEYRRPEEMQHLKFNSHEAAQRLQNLESLSKSTSAVSLRGAERIEDLRKLVRSDLSYYYLLSYAPPRTAADDEYHDIKVKIRRKGVKVRFRKGYTDYSDENERGMQLMSALYAPDLYRQLPFKADYVPYFTESGKYTPWINIALPGRETFLDRFVAFGDAALVLHVWVKEKQSGEKGYSSEISLPFEMDSDFVDYIQQIDNLVLHFKGPEIAFAPEEYQVIIALVDPRSEEIGTWESSLFFPDLKKARDGSILSLALGTIMENAEEKDRSFQINERDGSLEHGRIKFFPAVTGRYFRPEDVYVFMQVFHSRENPEIRPEFSIKGEDAIWRSVQPELLAGIMDHETGIWSGIFLLDMDPLVAGECLLSVEVPGTSEGFHSAKQMSLEIR